MKLNTRQHLIDLVRKNLGIRAKELILQLGLNPTGIFKHLKRLQEKGVIYKIGRPPEVHYYSYVSMDKASKTLNDMINWARSGDQRWTTPDTIFHTRDVLQARLDHLVVELQHGLNNHNLVSLLVATVGEIGNNSFDHNLGHWHDIPGVYFRVNVVEREIVLADRGQGVYATIKRVKPTVQNEADALRVAFTEMVSGRAPEKRGNGLKFVKKVVTEQQLHLKYYTGSVMVEISESEFKIRPSKVMIPGTAAMINF